MQTYGQVPLDLLEKDRNSDLEFRVRMSSGLHAGMDCLPWSTIHTCSEPTNLDAASVSVLDENPEGLPVDYRSSYRTALVGSSVSQYESLRFSH